MSTALKPTVSQPLVWDNTDSDDDRLSKRHKESNNNNNNNNNKNKSNTNEIESDDSDTESNSKIETKFTLTRTPSVFVPIYMQSKGLSETLRSENKESETTKTVVNLKSKRALCIIRLVHFIVAERKSGWTIESVFHFIRFDEKFNKKGTLDDTININNNQKATKNKESENDIAALRAGTKQDEEMINIIEACICHVAFALIRGLAWIRESGSMAAKQLGLYALLKKKMKYCLITISVYVCGFTKTLNLIMV